MRATKLLSRGSALGQIQQGRRIGVVAFTCGGGVGRVISNLIEGLRVSGWEVDLLCTQIDKQYRQQIVAAGASVYVAEGTPLRGMFGIIRSYLMECAPNLLISSGYGVNVLSILARSVADPKIPVILREDIDIGAQLRYTGSRVKAAAILRAIRWAYPRAEAIVGVSQSVSREVATLAGVSLHRVDTIYNPVQIDQIQTLATQSIAHPWVRVKEIPVMVGVGRLVKQKDFANLIQAFSIVRRTQRARLLIIGDGPERANLQDVAIRTGAVSADIEFTGALSNPFPTIAGADLLVLSSRWEGFGLVLVEAMALGTSVVSTNCPSGPSEILENGKWGQLVPVEDSETLASSISDQLEFPLPSIKLIERANDFSAEKAMAKYEALISRVMHRDSN